MKTILYLFPLALLLAIPSTAVAEDDGDGLDVTMSVMGDQEGLDEEEFFNEIELPDIVPEQAHSSAQDGTGTANEARRNINEIGKEQARRGLDRNDTDNRGRPPVTPPTP